MAPFVPAADVVAQDRSCAGFVQPLRMRVHRTGNGRATPPALIYFHPGRFIAGGLEDAEAVARALAERFGIAVVTPDYSLAGQCPFPAAAEDAYAALQWTHGIGVRPAAYSPTKLRTTSRSNASSKLSM